MRREVIDPGNSRPVATPLPLPPDEQFWKRYSPRHECLLSSAGSIVVHLLIFFGLLVLGGLVWLAAKDDRQPIPFEVVAVEGEGMPGEGGDRTEGAKGNDPQEAASKDTKGLPAEKPKDKAEALQVNKDPIVIKPPDLENARPLPEIGANFEEIGEVAKGIQQIIDDKNKSKPGSGGTKSPGKEGSGPGTGPGKPGNRGRGTTPGNITKRAKRQLRWRVTFPRDGRSYLEQLHLIEAIVVVPENGRFKVFRDLFHPEKAKYETISKFKEMYWMDDDPRSVGELARALQLGYLPRIIVAYFPQELEEQFLAEETRNVGGIDEDKIKETHFDLEWNAGKKKYAPRFRSFEKY